MEASSFCANTTAGSRKNMKINFFIGQKWFFVSTYGEHEKLPAPDKIIATHPQRKVAAA
jgi:hypothetical protein